MWVDSDVVSRCVHHVRTLFVLCACIAIVVTPILDEEVQQESRRVLQTTVDTVPSIATR